MNKKNILLIFATLAFFTISCKKNSDILKNRLSDKETNQSPSSVVVTDQFESEKINEKVWYSIDFPEKELAKDSFTHNDLIKYFKPNNLSDFIQFGNVKTNGKGWIYCKIINKNSTNRLLVLDIDFIRCDRITSYLLADGKINRTGQLQKNTPLAVRDFPFRNFAFPYSIAANDSIELLLKSERFYGIHEINLKLYSKPNFVTSAIFNFEARIFQVIFCFVLCIFMISTGVILKHRGILYFGFYLIGLMFSALAYSGFMFFVPYPPTIGLNIYNDTIFSVFFLNAAVHPFGYEMVKKYNLLNKKYIIVAALLFILNVCCLLLFFLPKENFDTLSFFVSQSMFALTILGMIFIVGLGIVLFKKAGQYWILLSVLVLLGPVFFNSIFTFLVQNKPDYILSINSFTPIVLDIVLIYMCFTIVKEEITLKDTLKKNLVNLKTELDQFRKNEVAAIGRNLHDQVGNTLASALGHLNRKEAKMETINDLILNAIKELRFLSHNLVKDDDKPLSEKTQSLISRFNDFSDTLFIFKDYSQGKINQLSGTKQQSIYITIQELLTNIIKHANAEEAHIQFFEKNDIIEISIEDDGVGFDQNQVHTGIGLQNIASRAKLSNLQIVIDSTRQGTSIIIETKLNGN